MRIQKNNDGHYHPIIAVGAARRVINGKRIAIDGSTRGRPRFEIDEGTISAVEHYASRGLNNKQMASCLGISYETFNEKKKEYSDFSDAIERGKAFGVSDIADSMYQLAKQGDSKMIIYYLNNVSRETFSSNPEINIAVNNSITLVVDQDDMDA